MKRIKLALILVFFCVSKLIMAQTKEDLQKQKLKIEKEINYTTELLNKTKSNKTKSLSYLKALEAQLRNKEGFLIALNIELSLLNKKIKKNKDSIIKVEEEIKEEEGNLRKLKDEYAKMIYAAFKKKGNRNNIMFVFSADDFNQAYKRMLYLKQYSVFRKNQAIKIEKSKTQLVSKKKKLAQQKDSLTEEVAIKKLLVGSKKQELESINNHKEDKKDLIKKLSKSEKLFKKQLKDKQKKARELEEKIREIIKEEIAKSREKNSNYNLTPEALALSSEFMNNKGRLPWPLEKGIIVGRYGTQKHVVFSGVETFNNGVDIATDKNAEVRVVFDGTVSRIFFIKGEGKAVLINHGEYFSVYSGLKEVGVKTGEKLLSKEKIGVVITHKEEDKTELHFEIWKGYDRQNPSNWLYNAY
jgi:murein hydrolase activator